ncbi:zinc finger BED domain-containing protein RICESLEEPER 2-like [Malania oleifera]|uniref:zinc finger BED domain-containing protein RICESLEEPER 2-like n=1 Tax=Malania oleifera TaxID=397392 RepID=UPI0025AE6388|nr:zinc finger BED domain-containing protein RICESLEEPER 2-like [Malania oleifera]
MAIERCLLDWGVDNVFTMTVDNASSNDVAIAYIKRKVSNWRKDILGGKFLHMRCTAHIINLIVQDGLKEMGDSVARVRNTVRYVRHSLARLKNFKRCSLYVTSNTFFDEISGIDCLLKEWENSDDPKLSLMSMKMKYKHNKYWENIDKMNMLIFVASVLDPRRKLGFVQYALSTMYEGDKGLLVGKKVQDTTFELFAEYKKLSQSKNKESNRSETSTSTGQVPISTVALESAFSTSGCVLDTFRSSSTPKIVQALICTQDWI